MGPTRERDSLVIRGDSNNVMSLFLLRKVMNVTKQVGKKLFWNTIALLGKVFYLVGPYSLLSIEKEAKK